MHEQDVSPLPWKVCPFGRQHVKGVRTHYYQHLPLGDMHSKDNEQQMMAEIYMPNAKVAHCHLT